MAKKGSVLSVQKTNSAVVVQKPVQLIAKQPVVRVLAVGMQGPPGGGASGGNRALFVLDASPTSTGIVGNKAYAPDTIPANVEILSCVSDTLLVRVHVGVEGGANKYSPLVTVGGVQATLSESSTKRWFTGYADLSLVEGANVIPVVSDTGAIASVTINVSTGGPAVLGAVFGAFPGSQTALKAGDQISLTVTAEADAVEASVILGGAAQPRTIPLVGGVGTATITITNLTGLQSIAIKAKNSFGTYGDTFTSGTLPLDQTYPTIGPISVTYPATKGALNLGDTATVSATVTNFDTVSYLGANLTVASPGVYAANKSVTTTHVGYVGSGANYTINAFRAANGAVSVASALVKIATIEPTFSITTSPAGRMVSSPVGIGYEVRVTPTQTLQGAPSLTASHGSWTGSWAYNVLGYWYRTLLITDATPRGVGTFTGLSGTGLSGIVGSTITSGSSYTVGGFSTRNVTFPAFSRVAPLGVSVAVESKLTANLTGGGSLTRYTDNIVRPNGFYPANADGTYNPTGSYIGLSDSVFTGSNTSGTLQVTISEAA